MATPIPPPDDDRWSAIGRAVSGHPQDGLVLMRAIRDDAGQIVDFVHEWVNESASRHARIDLSGRSILELYGPDHLVADLAAVVGTGSGQQMLMDFDPDPRVPEDVGRTFDVYLSDAGHDRVVGQYRDVTELRRTSRALEHQAGHDELTGVPNRRLLREHLERVLARTAEGGPSVLVMLADLDRFKQVNDRHGHLAGDRLLRLAAERMRAAMRAGDLVARYGGDEFVVVCHAVIDEAEAEALAARLRDAVSGHYRVDADIQVDVGVSVGFALTHVPVPPDDVMERADRALYAAKGARADAGGSGAEGDAAAGR